MRRSYLEFYLEFCLALPWLGEVEPDQPLRARIVEGRKGPLAVVVEPCA